MSYRILISILVCLVILGCGKSEWVQFSPDDAGFAVLMPGEPKSAVQDVQTAIGSLQLNLFGYNTADAYLAVAYTDYPQSHIDSVAVAEFLYTVREGMLEGVGGVLQEETEISLNGYPGRSIVATVSEKNAKIYARLFLVGNRLCQILMVEENTTHDETDRIRFFDSFRLLDR